jgi:hypothetical protein
MFDKYVEIGEENIVPEDIGKGKNNLFKINIKYEKITKKNKSK